MALVSSVAVRTRKRRALDTLLDGRPDSAVSASLTSSGLGLGSSTTGSLPSAAMQTPAQKTMVSLRKFLPLSLAQHAFAMLEKSFARVPRLVKLWLKESDAIEGLLDHKEKGSVPASMPKLGTPSLPTFDSDLQSELKQKLDKIAADANKQQMELLISARAKKKELMSAEATKLRALTLDNIIQTLLVAAKTKADGKPDSESKTAPAERKEEDGKEPKDSNAGSMDTTPNAFARSSSSLS